MDENWRPVVGYEDLYEISDLGRVRSTGRARSNYTAAPRILKPHVLPNGYCDVMFYSGGRGTNRYIHRLVADAFIPNPESLPEVNHKDEVRSNNVGTNLEWATPKGNKAHARTFAHYGRKLRAAKVMTIKSRLANGETPAMIAPDFAVGISSIRAIDEGRNWKHVA